MGKRRSMHGGIDREMLGPMARPVEKGLQKAVNAHYAVIPWIVGFTVVAGGLFVVVIVIALFIPSSCSVSGNSGQTKGEYKETSPADMAKTTKDLNTEIIDAIKTYDRRDGKALKSDERTLLLTNQQPTESQEDTKERLMSNGTVDREAAELLGWKYDR